MTTKIITGLQGEGKTHYAMKLLKEEAAKGRPCFTNIDGCIIDGVEDIPENEDGELDWQLCPRADKEEGTQGAFIVYDEAQKLKDNQGNKYFAHVNRQKLSPREVISELDEHRHFGYDILFVTQDSNLLHGHLTSLIKEHYHCSRPLNKKGSQIAFWRSVQKNPNAPSAIERAEDVFFEKFDDAVFKEYKSTEMVTDKKLRIPAYMWKLGIIAGIMFIGAGALFFNFFSHFGSNGGRIGQSAIDKTLADAGQNPKLANAVASSDLDKKVQLCMDQFKWTKDQCIQAYDPKQEQAKNEQLKQSTGNSMEQVVFEYDVNKPFDAVYEVSARPTDFPKFAGCMKKNGKYVAYTQQGTILNEVSSSDCQRVIENGDRPFDYFRVEQRERSVPEQSKLNPETSSL